MSYESTHGKHAFDQMAAAESERDDKCSAKLGLVERLRNGGQPDLADMAAMLVDACKSMIDWDHAENNAPPYATDDGAHWRMRQALCRSAFDKARAAIAASGERA